MRRRTRHSALYAALWVALYVIACAFSSSLYSTVNEQGLPNTLHDPNSTAVQTVCQCVNPDCRTRVHFYDLTSEQWDLDSSGSDSENDSGVDDTNAIATISENSLNPELTDVAIQAMVSLAPRLFNTKQNDSGQLPIGQKVSNASEHPPTLLGFPNGMQHTWLTPKEEPVTKKTECITPVLKESTDSIQNEIENSSVRVTNAIIMPAPGCSAKQTRINAAQVGVGRLATDFKQRMHRNEHEAINWVLANVYNKVSGVVLAAVALKAAHGNENRKVYRTLLARLSLYHGHLVHAYAAAVFRAVQRNQKDAALRLLRWSQSVPALRDAVAERVQRLADASRELPLVLEVLALLARTGYVCTRESCISVLSRSSAE